MIKTIGLSAVSLMFATSAWALSPAQIPALPETATNATEVQYTHGHKHANKRRVHRHRYRAGSRHARAPHGWRRHHARPRDWSTRGCIIVGALWFCP